MKHILINFDFYNLKITKSLLIHFDFSISMNALGPVQYMVVLPQEDSRRNEIIRHYFRTIPIPPDIAGEKPKELEYLVLQLVNLPEPKAITRLKFNGKGEEGIQTENIDPLFLYAYCLTLEHPIDTQPE